MSRLYSEYRLGELIFGNRLVMAPMTRCRAIGNLPNELMANYYQQRASAGLIITEGVSPSPNGLGYARIPGIFSPEQVEAWKPIAEAVHNSGGHIFMQLMHTGRMSHALNLPDGARVMAPSAIAAAGEMYTDAEGMQPLPTPAEMTADDLQATLDEFVQATKNAIEAGFDGVELHAANGYLLEQFIRPSSNQRNDEYGGDIEGRARFVLDVAEACAAAVGNMRVGIRLSPYGSNGDMSYYEGMDEDYTYLAEQIDGLNLAYIHLADHSAMGAPEIPADLKMEIRNSSCGTFILSGGYDAQRAEADLDSGRADLIGVGRPFIANPDLPARWQSSSELNEPDFDTFYTPDEAGYTDYPVLS